MWYLKFLREVHARLGPPTYLEIGINRGKSLAISHARTIGIDPEFELEVEVPPQATLFRATSDDHFARERPLEPFGGEPVALAFIDGMHLVEFVLRDFINVERHADWSGVALIDDILPRSATEATRRRSTRGWTGDVYKIVDILARNRPDLICVRVDVKPTGVLLIAGLDPTNRVLSDRYDEIVSRTVTPDPQDVPDHVLQRRGVVDPAVVLSGSFWSVLRGGRAAGAPATEGIPRLRRAIRRDLGGGLSQRLRGALLPAR